PRQRLRAVRPDEVVPVPDFLPPGTTWMPAPGHTVPAVAGQPPMVGYLVLVPADQAETDPTEAVRVPDPSAHQDPIRIDAERRTASVDGRALDLTYLEFEL